MVYNGKSPLKKKDDLEVPPWLRKPPYAIISTLYIIYIQYIISIYQDTYGGLLSHGGTSKSSIVNKKYHRNFHYKPSSYWAPPFMDTSRIHQYQNLYQYQYLYTSLSNINVYIKYLYQISMSISTSIPISKTHIYININTNLKYQYLYQHQYQSQISILFNIYININTNLKYQYLYQHQYQSQKSIFISTSISISNITF